MTVRQNAAAAGARRSRQLRLRLADELVSARMAAGISQRELGRRVGVSHGRIARAEAGEPIALTIDLIARLAAPLGLQLAASLYPDGDPVRDRGHLALLQRFRRRIHPGLRWRTEVPIPIGGDPRSGDAVIGAPSWDALVEAETHLHDIQLVERRASAKQRDLGADHVIVVVADTRHNREVLRLHTELRERFPIDTRACLRRLAQGQAPGGDGLVIL